ncbi:GlxA family transcriptional regulator [Marinovum sp.]|uniref:GlxA family transcriptional regulator n=1 Tax=Marinovum sp. TaxID=2024839 RepID=UPI003A8F0B36
MRNWTNPPGAPQEVAVLLFPRFSNLCLANAVEPMRAANELLGREAYRWSFVTLDGAPVESSSGLPVLPHCPLRAHGGGDHLFVLASYDVRSHATPAAAKALSAAARRFGHVSGMDTGAWLLAQAGLLDGARATIHWAEMTAFSERFDTLETVPDRVVTCGNRTTSGGAMAAFDTVLEMIRAAHGEALGLEVSAFFLHRSAEIPVESGFRRGGAPLVEQAITLMSATIEAPLPIATLAARLQTTQRTLSRAFQADLGAAPKAVYVWLRLAAARRYAEQSEYSITEIALRCGYANAAAMTRAFVAQYGRPPRAFRH